MRERRRRVGQKQVMHSRNIKNAVFVLVILLVLVFLIELAFSAIPHTRSAESVSPIDEVSLEVIMSEVGLDGMRGKVSAEFTEEVLDLSHYSELYVSETESVISFLTSESPESLFAGCTEELCAKGWTRVESGQATASSFVKGEGRYTWLFLDCASIGNDTSALIQLS
ncbi:MAG: hypothetical protein ACOYD7_06450 [Raoultibacter sp.]|jgi:hypothetical protein